MSKRKRMLNAMTGRRSEEDLAVSSVNVEEYNEEGLALPKDSKRDNEEGPAISSERQDG